MVRAVNRRPELGYQAAVNVATAVKMVEDDLTWKHKMDARL